MVRVFANGLGDQGSIPGWVIPKTQKMVLNASLLDTQYFKVWIKGKWSNPRKGVVPSSTPWCSSYWKGSLQVALDYSWLTYIYIYIYIYKRSLPGVRANVLNCEIVVSEFEIQSCYHIHIQTNTLGKGMSPFIPFSYGLNCTTTVL